MNEWKGPDLTVNKRQKWREVSLIHTVFQDHRKTMKFTLVTTLRLCVVSVGFCFLPCKIKQS